MAMKLAKSSPAENARPAPESTTARSDRSAASVSPVAASASNMARSRPLSFSGLFNCTSATPSSTDTVTRSAIGPLPSLARYFLISRFGGR